MILAQIDTTQTLRFDFTQPAAELEQALDSIKPWVLGVCFLFSLLAYYSQVWRRRQNPERSFEAIMVVALTVLCSAATPLWRPLMINLLYWPAETLATQNSMFHMNRAVNSMTDSLNQARQQPGAQPPGQQPQPEQGTLQKVTRFIWNLTGMTTDALLSILIQVIVYILGFIGMVLIIPFYFLQHALVPILFTFLPCAICGLALPMLRDKCVAFICMTFSVLSWPLGFSLVAAATNIVFITPLEGDILGPVGIRLIVAAFVMIFGTLLVPPTMFYIFLYGGTHIDPVMSGVRSLPMFRGLARR